MTYLGIDPDTRRIAWALIRDSKVIDVGAIPRKSAVDNFNIDYPASVGYLLARNVGAMVYIEDVFVQRNIKTYGLLCEVRGELKMIARQQEVNPVFVMPDAWRRVVFGKPLKGADRGPAEMAYAQKIYPGEYSPHVAAAICIAAYGCMMGEEQEGGGDAA